MPKRIGKRIIAKTKHFEIKEVDLQMRAAKTADIKRLFKKGYNNVSRSRVASCKRQEGVSQFFFKAMRYPTKADASLIAIKQKA